MTIVLIDGEGASGKMVLRSFLDGHPSFSVLPIHDMIADSLCDHPAHLSWLGQRDLAYVRRLLYASNYYEMEKVSLNGYVEIYFAANDFSLFRVDCDFYRCDSFWPRKLTEADNWTYQLVVRLIHEGFRASQRSNSDSNDKTHYVSVGFDKPNIGEKFLQAYPDGKILFMIRSVDGILASRARRTAVTGDVLSEQVTIQDLLLKDKVRKILARQERIMHLAKQFPKRVMPIDFQSLVESPEASMRSVASFLEVDYDPIMAVGCMLGQPMVSKNGQRYEGKVLDSPRDLLSSREMSLLYLEEQLAKGKKISLEKINLSDLIRWSKLRVQRYVQHSRIVIARLIAGE